MLLAMAADAQTRTAATPPLHLGRNIQTLREARGRTQQQIARVAGIPRATWANLESGAANPTLAVLIKVAQALQVRLEELIEPPRRTGRLYRAAELPGREHGPVTVRKLLPETIPGLEIERMELPPRARDGRRPAHAGHARVPDLRARADRAVGRAARASRSTRATWSSSAATSATATATPATTTTIAYSVIAFAPVGRADGLSALK